MPQSIAVKYHDDVLMALPLVVGSGRGAVHPRDLG